MDDHTRDMFAAMALQGLLAGRAGARMAPLECANIAFNFADAMMAEREKRAPRNIGHGG
jgi:hypothetical protein